MDKTLKDNLRSEFLEILNRPEILKKIDHQDLDTSLLKSAFDVLIERDDDDQATAFINSLINTLKTRQNEDSKD
jgi:hypothetical protein